MEDFQLKPWERLVSYGGKPYDGFEDADIFTVRIEDGLTKALKPVRWLGRKFHIEKLEHTGIIEQEMRISFSWIRTRQNEIVTHFSGLDLLEHKRRWWN